MNNEKMNNNNVAKDTQPTLGNIEDILSYIVDNIEPINFKLEKHPQRDSMKAKLKKLGISGNSLHTKYSDKRKNKLVRKIKEEINEIKINKADLKVIATDEIARIAKKLHYPLKYFNGSVHIFNGIFWESYDPELLKKFLKKCYSESGIFRTTASDVDFLKKGSEQLQSQIYSKVEQNDKILLNFKNGTLEFNRSGKFEFRNNHQPKDFLTYVLPYEYNAKAKCPMFKNYLDEVIPEKPKQKVLAEFVGSVFSNLKHEKMLILYGEGHNGKSVALDIIKALLGDDNVCNTSLEKLTASNRYYIGNLAENLLNISGDISTKANPDMVKKLSSRESVMARDVYKKPYQIENYARLAFSCNELPKATEKTRGYYRRFLILPFDVYITQEQKDPYLAEKINEKELPGILNWVLKGLERLEKNEEFTSCPSADKELNKYIKRTDTVSQFLEDKRETYDEPQQSSMLYEEYKKYCKLNKLNRIGQKHFSQELEKNGITKNRQADGYFFSVNEI